MALAYTLCILFTHFGFQLKTLLESLSNNWKPIINWKSLFLNQPHLSNGFACISNFSNWFLCPQAGTFRCNRAIHSHWPKFQNQISQIKHTLNIDAVRLQIFSNSFNSWSDLWKLRTINMIRVWIAAFRWLWLIFHVVSVCKLNHFYSIEFSNQRLYFLTYEQRNPVMFALQSRARNMNIVLFFALLCFALLLVHSIRLLPHHWLRFGINFLFRQHASKSCIELSVWPPLACQHACLKARLNKAVVLFLDSFHFFSFDFSSGFHYENNLF